MALLRSGIVAALDVGSTKICCFIARADGQGGARVIGIGHQISRGLKSGTVVDMDEAEGAIRAAVDAAERMARETVDEVVVSISGGYPGSHLIDVEVDIAGHEIGDGDLRRALRKADAEAHAAPQDREILHSIPAGYSIDGTPGYRDPRGLFGSHMGLSLNVVTAGLGPVRNLRLVAERCDLDIAGIVVSPYAAGLSALVEDETDLGVTLIDMGGRTTTIGVFYDGSLIHVDSVPCGGQHVTNDIARGLSTPTGQAERIKTLHGSAIAGPADDTHMLSVPQLGESGPDAVQQVPRSMLIGIVQPRIEETLELVRDRLERSGFARLAGRRAVLTGGACQLTGVRELAARVLDKQVRIGRPLGIQGLAEATEGPAFAVTAGLLRYAVRGPAELRDDGRRVEDGGNRLERIGRWFRENF